MITRINVTPIIDVALVLVIILLVTAPIITSLDMDIRLPEAHTRAPEEERNVSVVIEPEGAFKVDKQVVPPSRLVATLRSRLGQAGDDERVVVCADVGVPYGKVEQVLEAARQAGAKRLAIATKQKGGRAR
jgi:biopolymer transport protein ExbD